jgi:hypothetical protein
MNSQKSGMRELDVGEGPDLTPELGGVEEEGESEVGKRDDRPRTGGRDTDSKLVRPSSSATSRNVFGSGVGDGTVSVDRPRTGGSMNSQKSGMRELDVAVGSKGEPEEIRRDSFPPNSGEYLAPRRGARMKWELEAARREIMKKLGQDEQVRQQEKQRLAMDVFRMVLQSPGEGGENGSAPHSVPQAAPPPPGIPSPPLVALRGRQQKPATASYIPWDDGEEKVRLERFEVGLCMACLCFGVCNAATRGYV